MKKILPMLLFSAFSIIAFAQDKAASGEMKNFRFGGTITPGLFWFKPDNLKKFAADGAVAKFGVLINGEYSFSGNFAFTFGLGLASSGGKMRFTDTANYFFSDQTIVNIVDTTGISKKTFERYKLNSRSYSASYWMIPFSLKMRTNEIGAMRYFFQPGLNIGVRKKVLANDDVYSYKSKQTAQQSDLDITNDMGLIRFSALLSAGGEYYISGSTALVFSIGYDYGLSNVGKATSGQLLRNDKKPLPQNFTQNGVILMVGFLF